MTCGAVCAVACLQAQRDALIRRTSHALHKRGPSAWPEACRPHDHLNVTQLRTCLQDSGAIKEGHDKKHHIVQ